MEINPGGITFGDEALCAVYGGSFDGWLVHAAKDKCHRATVGYDKIASSHPEYLSARRGTHLFLNIVDAPVPIFRAEVFTAALDFIDEAVKAGMPIGVHCNQGHSRAPSIALLWKAKRERTIPDDSYAAARAAFEAMLPADTYQPGKGIETFLSGNWAAIR